MGVVWEIDKRGQAVADTSADTNEIPAVDLCIQAGNLWNLHDWITYTNRNMKRFGVLPMRIVKYNVSSFRA